ncbi:MAG: signal peptidase II [Gammaproteobacteria bacterium]|nr:MAG: signal peptidase II [Gammaproteobacteria bacterium]
MNGIGGRFALVLLVLALDQATKLWAASALDYGMPVALLPFFNLTLVHNPGAAFSFLADAGGWQRLFFIGLSTVVSLVLAAWIWRLPRTARLLGIALVLVLSGALGNLVDRVAYGYVIDFIDLHAGGWHWPAFNIADSAITCGVILLLADGLFGGRTRS